MSLSSAACCAAALVLIGFGWRAVHADGVDPNIDYTVAACGPTTQPQKPVITYGAKPMQDLSMAMPPANIGVKGGSGNVNWALDGSPFVTNGCMGDATTDNCGIDATHPNPLFQIIAPTGPVSPATAAGQVQIRNFPGRTIAAGDVGRQGTFNTTVGGGGGTCTWTYKVHVVAADEIGGWGDPHITTVDGVHYDFQGAGEYTALKKDKFEIQTRQRPVPTAGVGGVNEHTGLATCVSIYSGVALSIGSNQISLVPKASLAPSVSVSGQPAPSALQLSVNHKPVTLTDSGIDLRAGGSSDSKAELEGRIVKAVGSAYEFDTADGMQVVATPDYWNSQQTWYLNLVVHQASATSGIWGLIPSGSWLPALPNGTSVGQIPGAQALAQRYQTLYTTFGDAWRVTDATSLFDYEQGTNTSSFTVADWPRNNPTSCAIQGQPTAMPATPQVAAQACSGITDAAQKANCTFDVTVTGNTGFAETYTKSQAFRPSGAGWQLALAGVGGQGAGGGTTGTGGSTLLDWPWWVWVLICIIVLILIALLFWKKKSTP
jgi:hypothetical protein